MKFLEVIFISLKVIYDRAARQTWMQQKAMQKHFGKSFILNRGENDLINIFKIANLFFVWQSLNFHLTYQIENLSVYQIEINIQKLYQSTL